MKKEGYLLGFLLLLAFVAFGCAAKEVTESSAPSTEKINPSQTNQQTNTKDDFGCFYSCSFFPEGSKQMCEDWKAGKRVQWPPDCKLMQYGPCIKLCESEKQKNPTVLNEPYSPTSTPKTNGSGAPSSLPLGSQVDCSIFASVSDCSFVGKPGSQNYEFCKQCLPNKADSGIPDKDPNPDNADIYISDFKHGRIIRMNDMSGKGWVSFGTSGSGVNQFNQPLWFDISPDGKIYIPDMNNDRIVRIDDITGKGWVSYGISGSTAAGRYALAPPRAGQFVSVLAVGLDSKGRIYIVNGAYNQVVRIDDMTGVGWTTFGVGSYSGGVGSNVNQFNGLKGLAIDAQDRIYITDKNNYRVVRFNDMTGEGWTAYGSEGVGVGQFADDIGQITFDKEGKIYIADEHNNRIVRIDDMTGKGWIEFHGVGNEALALPQSVAVTSTGRIYIADARNNRVVRIDDMTGKGWIAFGPYGNSPSGTHAWQMEAPKGIFIVEK